MTLTNITSKYPCLAVLFDKYDQHKTMAYLEWEEGYYDSPWELLGYRLYHKSHAIFDKTLPVDITLWDRYIAHDHLDYCLWEEGIIAPEEESMWMYEYYQYPPESDTEENELLDQLNAISPFRQIPIPPNLKVGKWL